MTTFRIEQTTTGLKIKAITRTPRGREKSRIIGHVDANDSAAADRVMSEYQPK